MTMELLKYLSSLLVQFGIGYLIVTVLIAIVLGRVLSEETKFSPLGDFIVLVYKASIYLALGTVITGGLGCVIYTVFSA